MSETKKRCWPWSHQWTKWDDAYVVSEKRVGEDLTSNIGVEQRRRCADCGKLQIRVEWTKQ